MTLGCGLRKPIPEDKEPKDAKKQDSHEDYVAGAVVVGNCRPGLPLSLQPWGACLN